MKKEFKMIVNGDKIAFIEIEIAKRNNDASVLSICGEIEGSHGQICDHITPQTDLQHEFIELWEDKHLQTVSKTKQAQITKLVDSLIKEYEEKVGSIDLREFQKLHGLDDLELIKLIEEKNFSCPEKVIALCFEEEITLAEIDLITHEGGNRFSYGGREWLICTDEEADEEFNEQTERYIEECILSQIPENLQQYFDNGKFIADARWDGRGNALSSYDGHEKEQSVNGAMYFLYRN